MLCSQCIALVISAASTVVRALPVYPVDGHLQSRSACLKRAMYGRRPRCKRNLTFQRSVRVQPCIRPLMQPLWPLALM